MKYMLDTNICIYIIKQRPISVIKKFQACDSDDISISSVTLAELEYGVQKSAFPEKNTDALYKFLSALNVRTFGSLAAVEYGKIRSSLETSGQVPGQVHGQLMGPMDLMIAAHAISEGLTVVTNNIKEFNRVPELNIENWI